MLPCLPQEMAGRLWRNREASCLAMSDLLQASMAVTWMTDADACGRLLDNQNAPHLLRRGQLFLLCLLHYTAAAAAQVCTVCVASARICAGLGQDTAPAAAWLCNYLWQRLA